MNIQPGQVGLRWHRDYIHASPDNQFDQRRRARFIARERANCSGPEMAETLRITSYLTRERLSREDYLFIWSS